MRHRRKWRKKLIKIDCVVSNTFECKQNSFSSLIFHFIFRPQKKMEKKNYFHFNRNDSTQNNLFVCKFVLCISLKLEAKKKTEYPLCFCCDVNSMQVQYQLFSKTTKKFGSCIRRSSPRPSSFTRFMCFERERRMRARATSERRKEKPELKWIEKK